MLTEIDPQHPVTVLIVARDAVTREGLSRVLAREPEARVAGSADSLAGRPEGLTVDVEVVALDDLELVTVVEACQPAAHRRRPPLLVAAAPPSAGDLTRVFVAGAGGLVVLASIAATLPRAVRAVAQGFCYIDPCVADMVVQLAATAPGSELPFDLTPQQVRVLSFLPDGLSNREIAVELGLSVETVRTHVRLALAKIGASSRREAAEIVVRERLG